MELPAPQYYALEALAFLSCFSDAGPWSRRDISTVISRTPRIKERLKAFGPRSDPEALRHALKEISEEVVDQGTIKHALEELRRHGLVRGVRGKGYAINPEGEAASVSSVISLFQPLALTPCTREESRYECAKKGNGNCCSYRFYNEVGHRIREMFDGVTIGEFATGEWSLG